MFTGNINFTIKISVYAIYYRLENPLKQDIRGNKRMYVQFPFWQQVNELVAPVWIKYKASGFENRW